MKKKIILCLLIISIATPMLNISSYAVTLPALFITSSNYSVSDKMKDNNNIKEVEVGKTLQLYAVMAHGNEMPTFNKDGSINYDSLGTFVDETNLSGVTWTSDNNKIASVDNNGKVTGVAEGKTTITAKYNEKSSKYEINVTPANSSNSSELSIDDGLVSQGITMMVLGIVVAISLSTIIL